MHISSTVMLILVWILFGGIVGIIARAIFPGRQSMGWVGTICLGIAGSFVGGFLANVVTGADPLAMHATGWIGSIIGAFAALALLSLVRSRSFAR